MTETPYELLMKKQRARKNQVLDNIEKKDLKNRSISYNLKINSDISADPQVKINEKEKHNRINFANCLKKSFYYRKFFNKTIEGQITSEQFHKFKQKINKVSIHHSSIEKQPTLFRQIWESEIQRKFSLREDEDEKGLQIAIKPKDAEWDKAITLQSMGQGKKKTQEKNKKIEDICDIASERKCNLDFDLQIQGNKKSIRVKEYSPNKSPKKKIAQNQVKDVSPQVEKKVEIQPSCDSNRTNGCSREVLQSQGIKPPCTFFKRFQQKNKSTAEQSQGACIKITKIKCNLSNLNQLYTINNQNKSNTNCYYTCATPNDNQQQLLKRDIRSSWNSSHDSQTKRYYKVETAENRRINIRRTKKPQLNCFTNDIKGWNVHADNDEDLPEVFGQ